MTEWANADQLREKLLEKGKGILTDAELIGILIGSGSKTETAVELARRILSSVGNDLNALGKLNVAQLCKFKGIGEAKAISIIAALELGKRMKVLESPQRIRINNSKLVFEAIRNEIGDLLHEEFWVLYLDRSNHIIRKSNISKGGVSGTVVDARIIFKQAIENLASSIVLCHNHPSGNLKPSEEDIRITKKLKDAGKLVDIAIIDHIIIAGNNFFSFADEGLL
ncbi:MAG: DNA repair protein RadC [Bacteroidetes bacterium]|nr:DNA repair protein RadC [Bacteroidota bacterium]